jgi:hypothetical protein
MTEIAIVCNQAEQRNTLLLRSVSRLSKGQLPAPALFIHGGKTNLLIATGNPRGLEPFRVARNLPSEGIPRAFPRVSSFKFKRTTGQQGIDPVRIDGPDRTKPTKNATTS